MTGSHSPLPQRGHVALRHAILTGSADDVRTLLDGGCDIESPAGRPALLAVAADVGSAAIVELLVERGADTAWVSRSGWSAATFADANEFYELADQLVRLGAPRQSRTAHGYSSLHRAVRRGDVGTLLAGAGSPVIDVVDSSGATPLSFGDLVSR